MKLFSAISPKILVVSMFAALVTVNASAPAYAASETAVLRMMKSPTTKDATLARLLGKWRGRGTARPSAGKPAEATQCRFTNSWAASQRLVHLILSCRGTEIRFSADGYLGRSKGKYVGAWSTSTGRNAVMSGRRSGSGLALTLTATGNTSGTTPRTSSMTLKVAGRNVTAKLTAKDPKTGKRFTIFQSTMKR